MLEVSNEVINNVLVVKLAGRLDGVTSKMFAEKTGAPDQAAFARIVLDCKELNYISSEGLRVMLMTAKRAKSLGGSMTLCGVNSSVNEVLEISGFGALFGVHPNVDKAVSAIA
jgi:anti-anti-sigma factor